MSVAYQTGFEYLQSYTGIMKICESGLHVTLTAFTLLLQTSFQAQFLCGISIYGFVSVIVRLAFHIRGVVKDSDFPWFWIECINSALMTVLILVSSSLVVAILTKGCIITGIIGFITVLVYVLDTIELFNLANQPRARYVWTTPNMPE